MKLFYIFLWIFNAPNFLLTLGKSPSCEGYNICNIEKIYDLTDKIDNSKIEINISASKSGKTQISFLKKMVSDQIFFKYFSTGSFIMDSDFFIPFSICNEKELKSCTISKGSYEIIDNGDFYLVVF